MLGQAGVGGVYRGKGLGQGFVGGSQEGRKQIFQIINVSLSESLFLLNPLSRL